MLTRKTFRLILISIITGMFLGCSILNFSSALIPYPHQDSWIEITKEDPLYKYQYACGQSMIRIREISKGGWGFFGPPLIPVIPVLFNLFSGEKDLIFDIHISTDNGQLPGDPISLELLIPSQGEKYLPIETIYLQKDTSIIEKEKLQGIEFILAEDGKAGMTYLYKFDLDMRNIEEFEIIFLSNLNGCSIPNISYKQKNKSKYEPFVIPHPV